MGAFYVQFAGRRDRMELPNQFHTESFRWILERMLGSGERKTFYMGLSSRGLAGGKEPRLPQVGVDLSLSKETVYADVDPDNDPPLANSGGGAYVNDYWVNNPPSGFTGEQFRDRHRELMNYKGTMQEQLLGSFDVVSAAGPGEVRDYEIVTEDVGFTNAIPWETTREDYFTQYKDEDGRPAPIQPLQPWYMPWRNGTPASHGYPWHWPIVNVTAGPGDFTDGITGGGEDHPDQFDGTWSVDADHVDQVATQAAKNLHRIASLPMGSIYIASTDGKILVSARFPDPVIIRPGATLRAYWKGKLGPRW